MSQIVLTQGPTATTTCSHLIVPRSVRTPVTASELLPRSKPVTATPVMMRTPWASALPARP